MRVIKGYDTVFDTNTGEMLSVQRSTGEVLPAIAVNVPVGSIIYTPEEQGMMSDGDGVKRPDNSFSYWKNTGMQRCVQQQKQDWFTLQPT